MASLATLTVHDAGMSTAIAVPFEQGRVSVDWARVDPEEQFVRLAAGWRVMVVAGAAMAAWAVVGGTVVSLARGLGAL